MNALEAQLDYCLGQDVPGPGKTIDVAPGVKWARMQLPFALNHINVWLLRDEIAGNGGEAPRQGWTIVDCGIGNDATHASWETIFANTTEMRFTISDARVGGGPDVAWVTCTENILSQVQGRVSVTSLLATNIFERALNGVRQLTQYNPANRIPASLQARVLELCGGLEELLQQWERSRGSLSLQDSFHARHIAISYLAEAHYPGDYDVGLGVTRFGNSSFDIGCGRTLPSSLRGGRWGCGRRLCPRRS